MKIDLLKENICRMAFGKFRYGEPLERPDLSYEIFQPTPSILQVRVKTLNGTRKFEVKVVENLS
jgi:hypothetical protein